MPDPPTLRFINDRCITKCSNLWKFNPKQCDFTIDPNYEVSDDPDPKAAEIPDLVYNVTTHNPITWTCEYQVDRQTNLW